MQRYGDCIQTSTGRQFWPLDPRPEEIDIEDIAHALSNLCRYGGHSKQFYSVAQHSVLVSRNVPKEFALWGLLHDASEAYIVDVPRPIKPSLNGYGQIEKRLMEVICERFGLDPVMPAEVKRVDNAICFDEMQVLMDQVDVDGPGVGVPVSPWSPRESKQLFLMYFEHWGGKP